MRRHDWPQRLEECVDAARWRSFEYGAFDCCLFAADCVLAMTGTDCAAPFRGYESKIAAYRLIAEHGSLQGLLTSVLGEPVQPAFARRGDVVIAEIATIEGDAESVGICLGANCVFAGAYPHKQGIYFCSRDRARLAWRIQ